MKYLPLLLLFIISLSVNAQKENVAIAGALGMTKNKIIRLLDTKHETSTNANGSSILTYKIDAHSDESGDYKITCMFLINSDEECYYITAWMPETEYIRTLNYLGKTVIFKERNKFEDADGRHIDLILNKYTSGDIVAINFY